LQIDLVTEVDLKSFHVTLQHGDSTNALIKIWAQNFHARAAPSFFTSFTGNRRRANERDWQQNSKILAIKSSKGSMS